MSTKIYVASSWRNAMQSSVVNMLRAAGHEVYDFRNPTHEDHGFSWSEIDINWRQWSMGDLRNALEKPPAVRGFGFDVTALEWCDACLLLLPCGLSAHLEAGWCAGKGKPVCVYSPSPIKPEPELMYKLFDLADGRTPICDSFDDVLAFMKGSPI
jgi:hypothetical protein